MFTNGRSVAFQFAMQSLIVFAVLSLVLVCEGKVFTRCKLATELLKTKIVNKTFLGNWVCLIEQVSNRNTRTYNISPGGKKTYGLYQIPQRYCREGKRGGLCNIACESLLDDDILDDTKCANYIFELEGFKFWSQWTIRCKNNPHITTEIYKCPDLGSPRSSPEASPDRSMSLVMRYTRRFRRSLSHLKLPSLYRIRDEWA